jgi:hypothetical protein
MIVLLIAALALVALLVAGRRIARSRARERERRDRLAARRAAAQERAEHQRRRAADDASDALTSVLPAIRLPWPTQQPGMGGYRHGYPDAHGDYADAGDYAGRPGDHAGVGEYDAGGDHAGMGEHAEVRGGYPAFSDLAPFQAEEEPATLDRRADGYGVSAGRADDYALPRGRADDPYYAPPGRAADYSLPAPRAGEHGLPAEHGPGDHSRRRVAQGSRRGGHGKRRRG